MNPFWTSRRVPQVQAQLLEPLLHPCEGNGSPDCFQNDVCMLCLTPTSSMVACLQLNTVLSEHSQKWSLSLYIYTIKAVLSYTSRDAICLWYWNVILVIHAPLVSWRREEGPTEYLHSSKDFTMSIHQVISEAGLWKGGFRYVKQF